MSDNDEREEDEGLDLFKEPEGYYLPEKQHTYVTHTTLNEQTLTLRLVGHNPLWGHHLWNGARTISTYLETRATTLTQSKTILELGAGAGLPSVICALNGAKQVIVTDYPDAELIENLQYNIETCPGLPQPKNVVAEGYLWGSPVDKLKAYLPEADREEGFDVLILADLLFNHSEHAKLVSTLKQSLKKPGATATAEEQPQALVFFTPYRPWLLGKDLVFFDLARETGFKVEKILEELMEKVMFEEDPGDEKVRRTVFGYRLTWAEA